MRRHEVRIRLVHRPPQRRQVDAAQPARRHEARHRLRQAADDAEPDSRREELPGRAGRVSRHAGHPPAAAPDERADGGRRRRHDSAKWTCSAWSSTSRSRRARATGSSSICSSTPRSPVVSDPEQDRSDQEVDAAADACEQLRRDGRRSPRSSRCRPATGDNVDRLERVHHRSPAGRASRCIRRTT